MPDRSPVPVAWPAELFAPTTVEEVLSGTLAIHEAAHAVIAANFGYTVELIDITRAASEAETAARGWTMGTVIKGNPRDEPAAVLIAAARPATACYLHLIGLEGRHPDAVDEGCRHDDERLRHMCALQPELEPWVRNTAERLVVAQWPQIVHLAEAIIAARGLLDHPVIPLHPGPNWKARRHDGNPL